MKFKPQLLADLIGRVIDAGAQLERFDAAMGTDAPAIATPLNRYDRLSCDANGRGLAFRQHLAMACFLAGNSAMRGSRAFDNCFENNDGDQVVAFLVERARENPQLERAIAGDFSGTFPAKWLETAARVAAGAGEPIQPCLI